LFIFHLETGGIEVALKQTKMSVGTKEVRIGGGFHTIRQYLEKRLIDELHIVVSLTLLGLG